MSNFFKKKDGKKKDENVYIFLSIYYIYIDVKFQDKIYIYI